MKDLHYTIEYVDWRSVTDPKELIPNFNPKGKIVRYLKRISEDLQYSIVSLKSDTELKKVAGCELAEDRKSISKI